MFKSSIEHSVSVTDNGPWTKLMHTLKKQLKTYSRVFAKIISHESRAYSGSTIVGRVDFTVQVITNVHEKNVMVIDLLS